MFPELGQSNILALNFAPRSGKILNNIVFHSIFITPCQKKQINKKPTMLS